MFAFRRDNWDNDLQFDEVQQIADAVSRLTWLVVNKVAENVTTAQKNAIVNPGRGQIVFDTTLGKLCVYNGAAWETVTSV